MKSLFRLATLLAGACALAAQAQPQGPYPPDETYAPPGVENVSYAYADVLRTEPVFEIYRNPAPREECYDERVVTQEPPGGDPTGGTVLGAIIGGVIGNQVGGGNGRTAATVAGAVVGGAVGRNIDRNNGPGRTYESTQRRCQVVDEYQEERRVVGYDVQYRFRGEVYMSRLDYDPGDRLRVRVSVAPAD